MSADPDCLFCKIVAGEIPADVVRETETTLAFRDIEAQAPTHVLVIPKQHFANAAEVGAADESLLARMVSEAAAVADADGADGYRLVFNTGASANQSVFHAHLHLLGGRQMTWPPG
ncbi:MAG TPA: histidine triad nucleotide-binding protein [Nocardioidaceae bacterium]|nr:histidine triad nucleotide-binding protein [Nocardioidaceae bacterium]